MKTIFLGSLITLMSLTSYAAEVKSSNESQPCCEECARKRGDTGCVGGVRTVVDKSSGSKKQPSKGGSSSKGTAL